MQPGQHPDAIDTRFVFRIYSWIAIASGLIVFDPPLYLPHAVGRDQSARRPMGEGRAVSHDRRPRCRVRHHRSGIATRRRSPQPPPRAVPGSPRRTSRLASCSSSSGTPSSRSSRRGPSSAGRLWSSASCCSTWQPPVHTRRDSIARSRDSSTALRLDRF